MEGMAALPRNPLLRALQLPPNRDLLQRVSEDHSARWLVCIPQSCSLSGAVSRADLETHVMRPADGGKSGTFTTANGKTVTIVGQQVRRVAGFWGGRS